ncbi:hypothetical protein H7F33_09845 [Pedobacter sp. PAMC26386]|nr:hypothetical protein H7F33_09845 [Pedobacter sp. PAMC26386]
MGYQEVKTQKEYRELLYSVLKETQILINNFPDAAIYKIIQEEVSDILNIIENRGKLSEDEIYERYTIGKIAEKSFDSEKDHYKLKLQDVFAALFEYENLPRYNADY